MIITLCRMGLLKIYASFCELNISFYKMPTFRFADYTNLYSNSLSAILFLYFFMSNLFYFCCKYTMKSWNYQIWLHIFTQFG